MLSNIIVREENQKRTTVTPNPTDLKQKDWIKHGLFLGFFLFQNNGSKLLKWLHDAIFPLRAIVQRPYLFRDPETLCGLSFQNPFFAVGLRKRRLFS